MIKVDESGAERAAQVDFTTTRVLDLGQERLRAMQSASTAMDQRISQVAAFQLAAAALAGSLLTSEHSALLTLRLAFWSCAAFVAGAVLAFIGTAAAKQHLPGLPPSWWKDANSTQGFDETCAREWLAIETERSIAFNLNQDDWRARWLNLSLLAGLIGGFLVAGAAYSRLVPSSPANREQSAQVAEPRLSTEGNATSIKPGASSVAKAPARKTKVASEGVSQGVAKK